MFHACRFLWLLFCASYVVACRAFECVVCTYYSAMFVRYSFMCGVSRVLKSRTACSFVRVGFNARGVERGANEDGRRRFD